MPEGVGKPNLDPYNIGAQILIAHLQSGHWPVITSSGAHADQSAADVGAMLGEAYAAVLDKVAAAYMKHFTSARQDQQSR